MKTTIVPAQITTVEDRIIGNISPTQILLGIGGLVGTAGVFVVVPPSQVFTPVKLVAACASFFVCGILAIRFKERLVLTWVGILSRYYLRPSYHVFDKNDAVYRTVDRLTATPQAGQSNGTVPAARETQEPKKRYTSGLQRAQALLLQGKYSLQATPGKKGGVCVTIAQST